MQLLYLLEPLLIGNFGHYGTAGCDVVSGFTTFELYDLN